jgi:quercetin dioxygenase-like cupin family protein/DNA-binding XRE family transcriptional regulator
MEREMLSETLAAGLEQYKIGPKVRALRLKKKLGLVQLGEHTGLSSAMLSKIERGQLFPTLPTLLRIAMVFGVGLEHFFVDDDRPLVAVVRKKERLRLPDRQDAEPPSYFFESLDFPVTDRKMAGYYAEFPQHSKPSEPHRHSGAELIYVLRGRLAVNIDGEDQVLDEGDALHFDSGAPHSYCRQGRSACAAIVVVSPQSGLSPATH